MLADSGYGKSSVRLVAVSRHRDRHEIKDLTVAIRFKGDYAASYIDGDNSGVLPTDTMKNTVYALAAREGVAEPESFGLALAKHFLARNPRLANVRVDVTEHAWRHLTVGAREHGHAFMRRGGATRSATVEGNADRLVVGAGVHDLVILKSSQSAFEGFLRDEYTTLAATRDRLLATSLTATWIYGDADVEFGTLWRAVRATLLESFAEHDSRSVQHTLYAMGQAVLDGLEPVKTITLVMPNKHHLPVDLSRLGLENRSEIFVPTEEPFGLIEATLTR